jgi:hypothetical protein
MAGTSSEGSATHNGRGYRQRPFPGVELLKHCREAFGDADRLTTGALIHKLCDRDESPWREIRGKPLTDRGLAKRLSDYEIRSRDIRTDEGTRKGYYAADFYDAWQRHLPPSPASATSATKLINKNKSVADVADVVARAEKPEPGIPLDFTGRLRGDGFVNSSRGGWADEVDI